MRGGPSACGGLSGRPSGGRAESPPQFKELPHLCPVAIAVPLGLAECRQGFEDRRNVGNASADEIAGDGFGGDGGGSLHQVVAHGADALGEGGGHGRRAARAGSGSSSPGSTAEAGLGRGGVLEFGTEPADQAGALFGGTGGVEFDQAEKNVFGGKIRGPAVGFGDGAIEIVVEVAEDRDEAVVVNRLAGGD